jgi:hypothetical protein
MKLIIIYISSVVYCFTFISMITLLVEFLESHLLIRPPLCSSGQSSWQEVPGSIPGATRFSE